MKTRTSDSDLSFTPAEYAFGIGVHMMLFTTPAIVAAASGFIMPLAAGAAFMFSAPVVGALVMVLMRNRRTTCPQHPHLKVVTVDGVRV